MSRWVMTSRWVWVCAAIITATTWVGEASAQRALSSPRVPGYLNRPTISPYVNMFGNNSGGINQYFSFVRPQLQMQQFNNLQQQQVNQLNQSLQIQQQILLNSTGPYAANAAQPGQPLGSLQFRPTSATPSAATPHASYFNYSHYFNYPIQPAGTGRVR